MAPARRFLEALGARGAVPTRVPAYLTRAVPFEAAPFLDAALPPDGAGIDAVAFSSTAEVGAAARSSGRPRSKSIVCSLREDPRALRAACWEGRGGGGAARLVSTNMRSEAWNAVTVLCRGDSAPDAYKSDL